MGEEPRKFWTRPKISSQKEILDDNGVPNKQTFASGSNKPTGQTITMEKLFTCFQSKCPKGISTLQSLLFGEIQMDFFKSPDPTSHFFPFFLYWSFLRVWRCYGVSHAFPCGRVTSMASRDRKRSITNEVSEITARWSGPRGYCQLRQRDLRSCGTLSLLRVDCRSSSLSFENITSTDAIGKEHAQVRRSTRK